MEEQQKELEDIYIGAIEKVNGDKSFIKEIEDIVESDRFPFMQKKLQLQMFINNSLEDIVAYRKTLKD